MAQQLSYCAADSLSWEQVVARFYRVTVNN